MSTKLLSRIETVMITAERRRQDNERWLKEYEEFRRKVHC